MSAPTTAATLDGLMTALDGALNELADIDALRPPCPSCGGAGDYIVPTDRSAVTMWPCSDCKDTGKVSIEQLVATYNAVHGTATFANTAHADLLAGWNEAIDHLRAVKP